MPRTPRQDIRLNLDQSENALDRAISEMAKNLQIMVLSAQQHAADGTEFPETYQRLGDAMDVWITGAQAVKEGINIIRQILDE